MKYQRKKIARSLAYGVLCLLLFLVIGSVSSVHAAETYTFDRVTSNTPDGYLPVIEMTVDDYGSGLVSFAFEMTGPGSLTEIYFEETSLLTLKTINDSPPDLKFWSYDDPANKNGINPGNLPGGKGLDEPFVAFEALSLEAAGNTNTGLSEKNGLGEKETLTVLYEGDYDAVLTALALGFNDPSDEGAFRVGVHVRSLGENGEYSDSFVAVPAPGALLLAGLGVTLVGALRRRRENA